MRVDGNSSIDQKVYDLLKQDLNAASVRGKIISNNISNVNTKEYKRFDVVFEETLKDEDKDLSLKKTNNKHLDGGDFQDGVKVQQDNSSSMRSDGNNVDIDMEKVNQAANTLLYNTLITSYNNRLNSSRYVVTGGGR
ncbi:flagellar basal body rod protein FlgB [Clostridium frigidicarnis]|uniref:Flagellar basal body rod protein FlgB n=1 Tax=Clostridium frigidicarnis TaxID=84698 RepID=A0A1I0VEV7_9CLOT|nr:flagellar basal body rod protein FlgB [Clostridium frigidicarnis]SFA74553.1 flagellar basal-body rod protein FlgB [Clostridium frigidicarnis]